MKPKYRVVATALYLGGNQGVSGNILQFQVEKQDWFGWLYVTFCRTREDGETIIKHLMEG